MDDAQTRQTIQAHADAVVSGDFDHVVSDFTEDLKPQVPEIAKLLPQPVESAQVVSVDLGDDESVGFTQSGGGGRAAGIRPTGRDEDGVARIVGGEPA